MLIESSIIDLDSNLCFLSFILGNGKNKSKKLLVGKFDQIKVINSKKQEALIYIDYVVRGTTYKEYIIGEKITHIDKLFGRTLWTKLVTEKKFVNIDEKAYNSIRMLSTSYTLSLPANHIVTTITV
jgi:hypothetical protein